MSVNQRRYRTVLINCCVLVISCGILFGLLPENHISRFTQMLARTEDGNTKVPHFKHVTLEGVYTFHNVCLEPLAKPVSVDVHQIRFEVTQRIVVYDSTLISFGDKRLSIAGPGGHPWNYYDVHFSAEPLPMYNRTLEDNWAFFVSSRCPGNLHHFFQEEYIPLYSVIQFSGKLQPGAENVIVYPTPKTDHNSYCRNFTRYDEIIRSLHTNGFHDVYYKLPHNQCFRHAAFGSRIVLNDIREYVDHIIKFYNLSTSCAKRAEYVTIVVRRHRRIVNMDDLVEWVVDTGFRKDLVRTVDFDIIPIRQQMMMACTSRVMIGINGAALQWSVFMPEKSHVVEMSWPSRHWGFFFQPFLPVYRLFYHQVELKDIRVNWTTYEFRIRNGRKVGDEERQSLLKSPPQDLWKWSDAFLHRQELNVTLEKVYDSVINGSDSATVPNNPLHH